MLPVILPSRLLKKTHMLRCRSIASLQHTVSTLPLVDFSRALHLDLFEQPARGFFQHPASPDYSCSEEKLRQCVDRRVSLEE
jgi:hypothetical protein